MRNIKKIISICGERCEDRRSENHSREATFKLRPEQQEGTNMECHPGKHFSKQRE
jgi:hypothetical protein